jgi:hypothetical protein
MTNEVSIFSLLQRFALNKENIDKLCISNFNSPLQKKSYEKQEKQEPFKKTGDIFYPRQKDGLFWCFYIMKYGMDAYNELYEKDITIVVEKKIKIEWIEILRNKKGTLKQNKTAPLAHIENALLNEHKIDIKTFIALCVVENLPLMYVHNKTYYEMNSDTDEINVNVIVQKVQPLKYGIVMNMSTATEYNPQTIRSTYYKIDNINKPLKAISSYKYDELYDICDKLNVLQKLDQGKRTTKQILYEGIILELGIA